MKTVIMSSLHYFRRIVTLHSTHNLIYRDVDGFSSTRYHTGPLYWLQCTHWIQWTGSGNHSEQFFLKNLYVRRWEINSTGIQDSSTSGKFLGVEWFGVSRDIPFNVKGKLLSYLVTPTRKKQVQWLVGLFEC